MDCAEGVLRGHQLAAIDDERREWSSRVLRCSRNEQSLMLSSLVKKTEIRLATKSTSMNRKMEGF